MHEFVSYRFCAYDHAIWLRMGADMHQIIKRLWKKATPVARSFSLTLHAWVLRSVQKESSKSQQCIVFPDLRTMQQLAPTSLLNYPGVAVWHSWLTAVQQAKIFSAIKWWQIHTLLTTHAGIFQDRYDLEEIVVIDAHKWRYKSQQDPRYWTPSVLKHLSQLWNISYAEL